MVKSALNDAVSKVKEEIKIKNYGGSSLWNVVINFLKVIFNF